ncbi:acryloyl-CoA reductase [Paenibacillus humicola]|uniref:acrylyl-CoA reductase family protein n=1 Tax=Paenibacillus humicola TaxID=3110540 RepID=UPI00237C363C|nr:acryloyl-CoA reductase [Paenibacillus humicola]
MTAGFRALLIRQTENGLDTGIRDMTMDDLPEGEVAIRVSYSSVNYKDALACSPNGRVVKSYPMVPGIDLAGTVLSSADGRYREGDEVIVTGYELGTAHYGGYSEIARVPADWIVPLPKGLSAKEAMALGTAGLTAALSIRRLEQNGLRPGQGPVLVTGATGGVGSLAVSMLSGLGYEVTASTGKAVEREYLRLLGAHAVIDRSELEPADARPLGKQLWAGAVDSVGGPTLAYVLGTTRYGGSVAASGLTGGSTLPATVYPFILRGVSLLGIDSVYCDMDTRRQLWQRMAADLKPRRLLDGIGREIALDELGGVLKAMLSGSHRGRTIVRL